MNIERLKARIVEQIIMDLTDRAGLQNEWEAIDDETREEIRETWEGIVEDELAADGDNAGE